MTQNPPEPSEEARWARPDSPAAPQTPANPPDPAPPVSDGETASPPAWPGLSSPPVSGGASASPPAWPGQPSPPVSGALPPSWPPSAPGWPPRPAAPPYAAAQPGWPVPAGHPGYPPGYPLGYRPPMGPRPVAYPQPVRVEPVPGEPFGLAILPAPTRTSGLAVGSLTVGAGSLLVTGAVWCFGFVGAQGGWGGLVSGAFTVLAVLLGLAALGLGFGALRGMRGTRQIRGKGNAIAGMICGGAGVVLAVAGVVIAIVLSAQQSAG